MNSTGFTDKDVISLRGKTIVITGANTGLGYEAVNGPVDVRHIALDLGDLSSVRNCVEKLQAASTIFGASRRGGTTGAATLVQSSVASRDRSLADQLWNASMEMTGIDSGI